MSKLKPLIPVEDQIRAYVQEFEVADYMRLLKTRLAQSPITILPPDSSKWDIELANRRKWIELQSEFGNAMRSVGYDGQFNTEINWDSDWDGTLIERVRTLAACGFEIQRFYRKQKIDCRHPRTKDGVLWMREDVLSAICTNIGTGWAGVSFRKTGMSIWWEGGGPWKSFRG